MFTKKALAASVSAPPAVYVEDVFSTWLYTGNGSTQTITNGIDLAGEGGLTWIKGRSGATDHQLFDTARGATKELISNSTAAEATDADTLTAFSADGFSLGADSNTNTSTATYASWTFRKAAKFFDVVTYTGNGTTQQIAHNLGSAPGCVIVKRINGPTSWNVYHRSTGVNSTGFLNLSDEFFSPSTDRITAVSATSFTVGNSDQVNDSTRPYIAYLFAHDAGGFGDSGSDNVISCGSFADNSAPINLGWEPQWLLLKEYTGSGNWILVDNMRGLPASSASAELYPNTTGAESSSNSRVYINSQGFSLGPDLAGAGTTSWVYIAIRRGPMKTPTSGTEVFSANATRAATNGTASQLIFTSGFPVDLLFQLSRTGSANNAMTFDRLRGGLVFLKTSSTDAEGGASWKLDSQTGVYFTTSASATSDWAGHMFRRAPGFFDVVAYTGTGANRTVSHNLGVVPELMIVKNRSSSSGREWNVYTSTTTATQRLFLDTDGAATTNSLSWNDTAPTSTVFTVGTSNQTNESSQTFIAYLFATLPGISKVGSYTGTAATLDIDCGFTAGARFVLIKRTDSTGDWFVWDTARGIVSGNDPYLRLNSTGAEVTNTDYIDPLSSGFQISSTAPAAINASGGSFIFLAIA